MNKSIYIFLGPILGSVTYFVLTFFGIDYAPSITCAIAILTITWWVTEAVPIPVASIVPFALLPLFNVLNHKEVSTALGSHVILLLMGAFMLSKSLEKSGVHERLAILMVKFVGINSGKRLVFAFMLASALLSMWVSNTATILIMLPIALAILKTVKDVNLKVALILGIAYSASVGGLGTLIGTPPNVIFAGIYETQTGKEYSFVKWMTIGIPIVLIAVPIMALWLTRKIVAKPEVNLPSLGEWRVEEKRTLLVFGLTALAWITRGAPFGGWSELLGISQAGDSTVALAAVLVMFVMPNGKGGRLLDWDTAVSIPWGMLLLFAGGIALAKGFTVSGLSNMMGEGIQQLTNMPLILLLIVLCLCVTYLTEVTSNTATATLLMPILYVVAVSYGVDPAVLMIPAAMAASSAFMLPVATAPNAIAYGTGEIPIQIMVREGAALSFIISCLIALVCYLVLI
ncbi:SLC13/DASS family transporter [Glaciecola sp. MH2013]|uniref:SLC13 family permease n=1 Tax=Glaciecola sp. MH2013 TaxID=2785524 RepID=UPI00189D908D|nr:SLC13 family permease [Glaciecola sp. MH2013]MBF7072813.1 SLC13/DASS family transporter [Glaciecola sp. MH2013]